MQTFNRWEEIGFDGVQPKRIHRRRKRYRIRPGSPLDMVGNALSIVVLAVGIFGWVYIFVIIDLLLSI